MTTSDTVNPMLILGLIVMIIVMAVVNVYTLAYWQHPDDKNESVLIKVVILVGLQLASMSVLMIPIDVANNGGDPLCDQNSNAFCGGLDMTLCWEILFCTIAFFLVVPIPFATFYYEADDGLLTGTVEQSKLTSALISEFVFIAAVLVMVVSTYYFNQDVSLPVDTSTVYMSNFTSFSIVGFEQDNSPYPFVNLTLSAEDVAALQTYSSGEITVLVNFAVYLIAWVGWIGYWFFSVFAGGWVCIQWLR